ncbi:MAG: carboxypeptidase-like regulatory domain-containing protein [Actinomycetota bacterium]
MRRLALLPVLALLTLATPAGAAERGSIEGRVINETRGKPQAGVTVILSGGGAGVEEMTKTAVTDERGRYSFTGLPTGEEIFYAVDATFEGGLFAGRPISLPDDTSRPPVIDTTLRVWAPTTDPNAILIRRNDLFVVQQGGAVTVIESVRVVNPTNNAYIGRGSAMTGGDADEPTPSLGFALPDSALPETLDWVDADIDVPQTVNIPGLGFGITSAIPPGQVSFTFTYQVEGTGGMYDLSRTAPYAISDLGVFAQPPLEVTGNRLKDDGEVDIQDETYSRWSSEDSIDPADPIQILVVAEGGSSMTLIGGLVAGLLALLALAFVLFRRGKQKRKQQSRSPSRPSLESREDVISAIAELDLRHDNDEIADDEWAARRATLKTRLEQMRAEPLP